MSSPWSDNYWGTSPSDEESPKEEETVEEAQEAFVHEPVQDEDKHEKSTNTSFVEKEDEGNVEEESANESGGSLGLTEIKPDVRKVAVAIPKGVQSSSSGPGQDKISTAKKIAKPVIQLASQDSYKIPAARMSIGIPKAGNKPSGVVTGQVTKADIKVGFKDCTQEFSDLEEGRVKAKPLKSILRNRDPTSTEVLRTHSGNRVGFKRHLEFYADNEMDVMPLVQFVCDAAYENFPFWHNGWFETSWNSQPVLQLQFPPFSSKKLLFFIALLLSTAFLPLFTILIPIKAATGGSIIDQAGFSMGMTCCLGWISGAYSVFFFEQFFGSLLPMRSLVMLAMGPLSVAFHAITSISTGMMLPYGPDMVVVFVVFVSAMLFGVCMPKDIRKKAGFITRLGIGSSILGVSITCIRLLRLMEAAKTRGSQVAYALVLILPIIFTRLSTDVQEGLPYASSSFSMVAQGLLTWVFSTASYMIILQLAVDVRYYKLYLTYSITDTICLCGVGPIWSLWSGTAYLKSSRFAHTIFGWAQNPIKPKPVMLKSFTRMMSAIVMPFLLTILNSSHNQDAFNCVSDDVFGEGKLLEMWSCMLAEVAVSLAFIALVYHLMKVRCAKDAFNDIIIQFSKYTSYVLLGGTLVSLHSIMISALPANGGFLD